MSRRHDEQAIALAGVFQAASLVDQIAHRGLIPQNSFEASINSIFVTSPKTTEDVYGGARELPFNLGQGFKNLIELVNKKQGDQSRELTRYALSMLHLEQKLSKNPQMLAKLGDRLEQIRQQARFFDTNSQEGGAAASEEMLHFAHPSVVSNIATLYQETLSTFSFRIHVTGDPRHLQNTDNANKIRALLLAGVRAAMLWRQVGGKRWHLLFFRTRVAQSAQRLMRS